MPTVIPGATNWDLSFDLLKLLVAECIQVTAGDNFVDGYNGTPEANRFHLFPDYLPDEPDFAGAVTTEQLDMEPENPVRRAAATILLRAPSEDSSSAFSGRRWAQQACEAIASYIRSNTGEYKTLTTMASGRKVLSFHEARIIPIGEDNAQRWVQSIIFEFTYTEHETP